METQNVNNSGIRFVVDDDGVTWYMAKTVADYLDYSTTCGANIFYRCYLNLINIMDFTIRSPAGLRQTVFIKSDSLRFLLTHTRKPKAPELIRLLGFGDMLAGPVKEAIYISQLRSMFPKYDFRTQYTVGRYKLDLYSPRYNIVVECDEMGHQGRDPACEMERTVAVSKALDDPSWVRFNPDAIGFSVIDVVAQITTIVDAKFDL